MRTVVIFYSRTGHTRKAAEAVAGLLDADLVEVRCERYRKGMFRYFLAGYDSVKGNLPLIDVSQTDFAAYDAAVIGTPIWTSHPSLPIRAFLAEDVVLPDRVALFVTQGGHSPPERAFEELEAQLQGSSAATLALGEEDVEQGEFTKAVQEFAARVTRG